MAYLHCHNCGWSQDDFWDWKWTFKFWKFRPFGYNPISLIIEDFKYYTKPQFFKYNIYLGKGKGYKSTKIHSWQTLLFELKHHSKRLFRQKWWTYESWKYDKKRGKAFCPECGSNGYFDID